MILVVLTFQAAETVRRLEKPLLQTIAMTTCPLNDSSSTYTGYRDQKLRRNSGREPRSVLFYTIRYSATGLKLQQDKCFFWQHYFF